MRGPRVSLPASPCSGAVARVPLYATRAGREAANSCGRRAWHLSDGAARHGRRRAGAKAPKEAERAPRGETDSPPAFPSSLVPPPEVLALQRQIWKHSDIS